MEYVFYMDLFFLTDFFLNLLSLILTAAFLQKQICGVRMALAAVVGSVWNCALVLWPMESAVAELLVTVVGVGSLMAVIAFWGALQISATARQKKHNAGKVNLSQRRKRFAEAWVWIGEVFSANVALCVSSGILAGCLYFVKQHFFLSDWECLVFAGLLTGAVGIFLQSMLEVEEVGKLRLSVRLHYRGESREFTALADSGNRLRVPETGKPVSLISYQDCQGFCDRISGGFFIPYRAVGTEHGLLFAITFEKMEIKKNGTCITIENPAVAIVRESLSSNGDFNMLLPEEYVSGISDRRKSA